MWTLSRNWTNYKNIRMETRHPLLSICIPTYNRSSKLKECIESIIDCEGFDENVEIVISDNASSDDTEIISQTFAKEFYNIKYFKNDENIRDENFPLALDRATGDYIKLLNDKTRLKKDALVYLKENVNKYKEKRIPIFFTNNFIYTRYKADVVTCNNFDEYVQKLSTFVTAISCFGVWNEQWAEIKDRAKCSNLMLNQDDWSYQILEKYGQCILLDRRYYDQVFIGKQGGYNWFQIHLKNYFDILQPYVDKGLVSKSTLKQDRKNLLYHFLPEILKIYTPFPKESFNYETEGTSRLLWIYYKNDLFFYVFILQLPFLYVMKLTRYILRTILPPKLVKFLKSE